MNNPNKNSSISKDRLFEMIFNQASIGIAIVSLDATWVNLNSYFCNLLGYSQHELIGKKISDFTPPSDFSDDKLLMKKLIIGEIKSANKIKRYIHKSGEIIWIEITANLIKDEEGKPLSFLVFYKNLTKELKVQEDLVKSQLNFKQIVEKSPLPIIMTKNDNMEYINPQLTKLLGYTLEDIPTALKWFEIAYPDKDYRLKVIKIWQDYLKKENFMQSGPIEFTVTSKNGEKKDIEIHMINLNEGKYLYIFNDITYRKKIEEERIRSQKLESIGALAGGIAHDFNNILVGIMGNISLIKTNKENFENEIITRLDNLEFSVKKAQELTTQLLTFAKGGHPIKKLENIEMIIESSIDLVMSGSKSKCKRNYGRNIPLIFIDSMQIQQVINNILINADYSMKEGGIIEIKTELVSSKDIITEKEIDYETYLKIDIKDQGEGIPEEIKDKIFLPYFSTKKSGTGLGLASAFSIISKHEGLLNFHNNNDKGATFSIYLPIIEINDENEPEIEVINENRFFRILILDDDEMVQRVISAMLEKLGHQPTVVSTGDEFLDEYKQSFRNNNEFDLLIMDLTIPGGKGGQEVIKNVLQLNPKAKAIVSSGYSNDQVLSNYQDYGFIGVLLKPYTIENLKKCLSKIE